MFLSALYNGHNTSWYSFQGCINHSMSKFFLLWQGFAIEQIFFIWLALILLWFSFLRSLFFFERLERENCLLTCWSWCITELLPKSMKSSYFLGLKRIRHLNEIPRNISKGYRPEARGYVIYFPRALPEGKHDHITKSWRPINGLFLHWRGILKGCKNTMTKNASKLYLPFVF